MALASPTRNFPSLLPAYSPIFGVSGLRFCGHEHQKSSRIRPGGRTISFTSGLRGMRLVAVRCPRRVGAGMMISFCARVVIYGDNKIRSALMCPAPKAHKSLDLGPLPRLYQTYIEAKEPTYNWGGRDAFAGFSSTFSISAILAVWR